MRSLVSTLGCPIHPGMHQYPVSWVPLFFLAGGSLGGSMPCLAYPGGLLSSWKRRSPPCRDTSPQYRGEPKVPELTALLPSRYLPGLGDPGQSQTRLACHNNK